MSSLSEYRKNFYSQNGEDGVIEEICSRLGLATGSFVEFGAWDGKFASNTYRLLESGWKGVYIEADKAKFQDLARNMRDFRDRATIINAYVEKAGDQSLDNLLRPTTIEKDFELLSIDIDSHDWHVWHSLRRYTPKIVVIEINSSIPVGIIQTHRESRTRGSSFTATVELGKQKGYTPVCHTGNLRLVRNDLVSKLALPEDELDYPELLFDYGWKRLSYEEPIPAALLIIVGFAGYLHRLMRLPRRLMRAVLQLFGRR